MKTRSFWLPLLGLLLVVLVLALVPDNGCRSRRADPSAYTELGVPGPRYQLGWGEDRVPWADLSVDERTGVLRRQLSVIASQRPDVASQAHELEDRVDAARDLPAGERVHAVERLRMEVRALDRR